MNWMNAAIAELFSLFVDDIWFSAGIIAWIIFGTFQLPKLPVDLTWDGPILFLGCGVILVFSTWRAARVK